jgi:hypothetical protein
MHASKPSHGSAYTTGSASLKERKDGLPPLPSQ